MTSEHYMRWLVPHEKLNIDSCGWGRGRFSTLATTPDCCGFSFCLEAIAVLIIAFKFVSRLQTAKLSRMIVRDFRQENHCDTLSIVNSCTIEINEISYQ